MQIRFIFVLYWSQGNNTLLLFSFSYLMTYLDISELLNAQSSPEGFTAYLKGEPARYIVAFTNNAWKGDFQELLQNNWKEIKEQIEEYAPRFDNLTIWGWTSSKDWLSYLDIWTAVDDLENALAIWKANNQQAIRDNEEFIEISCQ